MFLNRCMLLIMNDDQNTQVFLHVCNKVILNCAPKGGPWTYSSLVIFSDVDKMVGLYSFKSQFGILLGSSHVFSLVSYPNHLTLYSYGHL